MYLELRSYIVRQIYMKTIFLNFGFREILRI